MLLEAMWQRLRYYGNMVDAFTSQLEESNPVLGAQNPHKMA